MDIMIFLLVDFLDSINAVNDTEIDSRAIKKNLDEASMKSTFTRNPNDISTISEVDNSPNNCCKDRGIPIFCIGFCRPKAAKERSFRVGAGKCKEYLDDIKACRSINEGGEMLTTSRESITTRATTKVF